MTSVIKRFITLENLDKIVRNELHNYGSVKNLTNEKIASISKEIFTKYYKKDSWGFDGLKKGMIYSSVLKYKRNLNVLATALAIKSIRENPRLINKLGGNKFLYSFGTEIIEKINSKMRYMLDKVESLNGPLQYKSNNEINNDLNEIKGCINTISFLIGKDKVREFSSKLDAINPASEHPLNSFTVRSLITTQQHKSIEEKLPYLFRNISCTIVEKNFLDVLTIDDYEQIAKNPKKITDLLKQKEILKPKGEKYLILNGNNARQHADLTYLEVHKGEYIQAVYDNQDTGILDEIFINDLEKRFSKDVTPFLKGETKDPKTEETIYHGHFIYKMLKSLETTTSYDKIDFQDVANKFIGKNLFTEDERKEISRRFGRNDNPFTNVEIGVLKEFFEKIVTDTLIKDIHLHLKITERKSSNPLINLIGKMFRDKNLDKLDKEKEAKEKEAIASSKKRKEVRLKEKFLEKTKLKEKFLEKTKLKGKFLEKTKRKEVMLKEKFLKNKKKSETEGKIKQSQGLS